MKGKNSHYLISYLTLIGFDAVSKILTGGLCTAKKIIFTRNLLQKHRTLPGYICVNGKNSHYLISYLTFVGFDAVSKILTSGLCTAKKRPKHFCFS